MSTLVLNSARAVGAGIGGNLGARLAQTAGQFALSYANQTIGNLLDNRRFEGPRLKTFHVMTSQDGAPMPLTYGRVRLAGQVIWASRLNEKSETSRVGSKGGPTRTDYNYSISFALGLCEGVIESVDRIWINGEAVSTSGLNFRVYKGTSDQSPDPLIAAIEGAFMPAFRDTAYLVFEDFPLDDYGTRLPQINVEVTRKPAQSDQSQKLETQLTGVHLLPSSGEFVYDTEIVEDISNPGEAKPINLNNLSGEVDLIRALDQLETSLPACRNVSLVVSWFGTDLRAGECKIKPGVEIQTRLLEDDVKWRVSGIERAQAYVVSQDDKGRPNYGGTPSDESLMKVISLLKSRGYKVTFYPFILMDIPKGNGLNDPYGGSEQAAFPWRGRITCHPAIGQANTVDQTNMAAEQIDNFFGTSARNDFSTANGQVDYTGLEAYSFRQFILHYAHLCALAGGVDRFVIGSEMVGLTTIRDSHTHFPVVEKLIDLASDVRSILGDVTKISYAADWSEYLGYHPVDDTGDIFFHLDPLWAHEAINAVAIDAYFPLSDWRDGETHLDALAGYEPYDPSYLQSNIEGGEGFDWYYDSPHDRLQQIRTPIIDTAYGKDWVFRYKDMRSWWSEPHYNRIDGQETLRTEWQAQSKPIWLMEIGCPAVDKGANQPNVFFDPKSAESHLPYFSNGARDDKIQRVYLESVLDYWAGENNPLSDLYNAPMIDMDASHVWCWDARPFPDFPARERVWSDGQNWQRGHWLTGRVGRVALRDVVYDLTQRAGLDDVDVSNISGLIEGYTVDRPMSARAAIEPLSLAYGFDMAETDTGLIFLSQHSVNVHALSMADLGEDSPGEVKADAQNQLKDVRFHFIDMARDYQSASLSARGLSAEAVHVLDVPTPIVMNEGLAKNMASRLLLRSQTLDRQVSFTLSPNRLDVCVGDVVSVPEIDGQWQIEALQDDVLRHVSAKPFDKALAVTAENSTVPIPKDTVWWPKPIPVILDIPALDKTTRSGPLIGAVAKPFAPTVFTHGQNKAQSDRTLYQGTILTSLSIGPLGRWDKASSFQMSMADLPLASVSEVEALAGQNRFAIKTALGWEIIAAQIITLISEGRYEARHLLRGLAGSEADRTLIEAGADIIWLESGLSDLTVSPDFIGSSITATATMVGRTSESEAILYQAKHMRPLSPVHGRVKQTDAGVEIGWIERTDNDDWGPDLQESDARFTVSIKKHNGETQSYDVQRPELTIAETPMSDIEAISIAQIAERYGEGPDLIIDLSSLMQASA